MPHLPASAAGYTPEDLRAQIPRMRGETIADQPSLVQQVLETLIASAQHPAGDLQMDAVAQTAKLPPALLRHALRLPAHLATLPGASVLQHALDTLAGQYPRIASHLRIADTPVYNPRMQAVFAELPAPVPRGPGRVVAELAFNPNFMRELDDEAAKRLSRHEFGHVAQFLSDPTHFRSGYQRGVDTLYDVGGEFGGYAAHPAEILARAAEQSPSPLPREARTQAQQAWHRLRRPDTP